ncbi:MAG: beta-ketoacyl-ACP synthase II [Thalassolituus sp.]
MKLNRVVVTGLGTVNPLGLNVVDFWSALVAGKSGIRPIEHFDTEALSVKFGGDVKGFDPEPVMPLKDARKVDLFIQYGMVAAEQAIVDSGITGNVAPERCGVAVGSGVGGLGFIENNTEALINGGPRRVSPFLVPGCVVNMASGNIAIRHGFKGPNFSIATACTTGTHNIGYAARTIALGDADAMIAGGTEMAASPVGMAGFAAARALSTRNDAPEKASRPWDKDRDGFVLSSGAAVLVLESYEHATARGAHIYAEITGFGMSDDAYHITTPPETGEGAALAMTNALRNAGLAPADIGYINAHGTSTPLGDIAEVNAIKSAFGASAADVSVSSTKSMTGHLLGAAGALEALICIQSLQHQLLPPTINLDEPSEGCDLDFVPHTARAASIDHVMSNSFGFGGTNGTLIFSKVT